MKPPSKSAQTDADRRLTGGLSESARAARIQRLKENAPSVLQTKSRWTATHSMMGALGAAFAVAAVYYLMNIYDAAAQQQRVPDQEGLIRDVSMAEAWERDPLRVAAEEALAAAQARENTPPEPVEIPAMTELRADLRLIDSGYIPLLELPEELLTTPPPAPALKPIDLNLTLPEVERPLPDPGL